MKNLLVILTLIFGALLLTPTSAQAVIVRSRGYHHYHNREIVVVHRHHWVHHRRVIIVDHPRYRHHREVVIVHRSRF